MKSHIAKEHRGEKRDRVADDDGENETTKKAKPEEEKADDTMDSIESDDEDDSEDKDDDFINKFDNDGNPLDVEEIVKMDTEKPLEVANEDAEIMILKDEIAVKNARIDTLEDAMKVKEELLHLANAKVETLEIDNIEKDNKAENTRE